MTKIITFGALKGGVGKTITAFNVAGILAENQKKVLVVDADPQGNMTNNFGVDRTAKNFRSIQEVFEDSISFDDVIIKSPIKELPHLDLIPSSIFLAKTELQIISIAGRELILQNFFEDNKKDISYYDYIILDTNPSMSIVNQNAFIVADSIVLLSDVSMNAMEGVDLFIALWYDIRKRIRKDDNVKALIVNNLDKRIRLSYDFIDYCKDKEGIKELLLSTVVPVNVKLKESELEAKPINLTDKKSTGYNAYLELIEELKGRGVL